MGKDSAIEWTDHTWNPWMGCTKISPGCKNCYMYRDMKRYGRDPKTLRRASPGTFQAPLRWTEKPARVFTCSWSDFFLDEVEEDWLRAAWTIIHATPMLTYQILTKRPWNIKSMLPEDWGQGYRNVWLGTSVETSEYLWRVEQLAEIPARVRFISYEPALGPVDFTAYTPVIQWIIGGGESGAQPRRANPDWFREVRDCCQKWGVAYFHKQNGGSRKIDGAWGGRELDGRTWNEFPLATNH